jgi:hypothetical protein
MGGNSPEQPAFVARAYELHPTDLHRGLFWDARQQDPGWCNR